MTGRAPRPVLIADDSAAFRRVLREFLRLRFPAFEVQEARTGAAAIAHCTLHPTALVMMDIHLTDMSGLEATRRIRHAAPATVVIAMSAMPGARIADQALAAGAAAFVRKERLFDELPPLLAPLSGGAEEPR
jgi:CheY-like chemotaxis protein